MSKFEVTRWVRGYGPDEKLVAEYALPSSWTLPALQRLFGRPSDDLMFESYPIGREQAVAIGLGIGRAFDRIEYFLEADAAGREFKLVSFASGSGSWPGRPFVTLLPAFTIAEREQAEALAVELCRRGSVELCCFGPDAELLHDCLDEIICAADMIDTVTSGVVEPREACEYFVHAAAAGRPNLLAFLESHPLVQVILEEELREQRSHQV